MLPVTLNRLTAEKLLAEAGAQQNSRDIIEKHLQRQRDLFQNFIDFKKALDRVWHADLWQVFRSFNTDEELVQAIQALYENSSSAVLLNSQLREFFKTTVGVHQGCLLSTIHFNLFLEKIMQETLPPHIHLHWWKADMQPTICPHPSYGRQQWQTLKTSPIDS